MARIYAGRSTAHRNRTHLGMVDHRTTTMTALCGITARIAAPVDA
jgi:hypothetical protein